MRYLLSRANLFGLGAAAAIGVAALFGVFGAFWPLAVVGAYGLAAAVAPREAGHRVDVSAARAERDVRRSLDEVVAQSRTRTDDEVAHRISEVRRLTLRVLEEADPAQVDANMPTIRQIALEYLPITVENYLNIPNLYRRIHRSRNGKTAHDELAGQLELLAARLEAIVSDVGAGHLRELVDHGIFLETRFTDPLTW